MNNLFYTNLKVEETNFFIPGFFSAHHVTLPWTVRCPISVTTVPLVFPHLSTDFSEYNQTEKTAMTRIMNKNYPLNNSRPQNRGNKSIPAVSRV